MKIDLNDPRITAFALGELKGNDAIELARAVRTDARMRAAVDEARETSSLLMETLGGDQTHFLKPEQRDAVRSAGTSPVITDITSAKVPFWKTPAVAGIGVAAAVALTFYIVGGRPGSGSGNGVADPASGIDWAQVDMNSLMVPATSSDSGSSESTTSIHAVSASMSDDTANYRNEVKRRIGALAAQEIISGKSLPPLENSSDQSWSTVAQDLILQVPAASGATSWPWIERSIEQQKKLPPHSAVRIEEMINHFRYKTPTMISGGGLVADMEICHTPWNPESVLLAVHLGADASLQAVDAPPILTLNSDRVVRVRLLGYTPLKMAPADAAMAGPAVISRSHGNYVIYELVLKKADTNSEGDIATLTLGKADSATQLPIGRVTSWIHSSSDLRFASAISACGMLLSATPSAAELDASRLANLVDIIEQQDSTAIGGDRRDALKLIRQTVPLLNAASGN